MPIDLLLQLPVTRSRREMKIWCALCKAAEAAVLCWADDAALCWVCDAHVHGANGIAGNHQRYRLLHGAGEAVDRGCSSSSRVPKCDICREAPSCFFCLEDRAMFCQECDVAIHTANPYVSIHQRFVLTGEQVSLDSIGPVGLISTQQFSTAGRAEEPPSRSPKEKPPMPSSVKENANVPLWSQGERDPSMPPAGHSGMPENTPDWPLNDLFVFPDFNRNCCTSEQNNFKADNEKLGSTDGVEFYWSPDQKLNPRICSTQMPDFSWTVPESPSPPLSTSMLQWQRDHPYSPPENAVFVPDLPSDDFNF